MIRLLDPETIEVAALDGMTWGKSKNHTVAVLEKIVEVFEDAAAQFESDQEVSSGPDDGDHPGDETIED